MVKAVTSLASTWRWRPYPAVVVIATREIYQQMTSSLVWTFVLFAVLMTAFSSRVGLQELESRRAEYAGFVAQLAEAQIRGGGQITGWQLEPTLRAIRPPEAVSALVGGADSSMPQFWDFAPAGVRSGQSYVRGGEPTALDLEVIIRVVLGLLAMLLAIDSVAGERASGALLALVGQPLKPSVIVSGKLLGGAITLLVAVTATVAVACLIVLGSDRAVLTTSLAAVAMAVGAAGWLYLCLLFSVGVLTSVLIRSYPSALSIAIIVWLVLGATGVEVSRLVARSISPVAPIAVLEDRRERVAQELVRRVQVAMGDKYEEAIPSGAAWMRPDSDPATNAAARSVIEPIWSRHATAFRAELDRIGSDQTGAVQRQRRIRSILAYLSPGAQFTEAATGLAGTGDGYRRRWEEAIERRQQELNRILFSDPARITLLAPANANGSSSNRWIVALSRRQPVNGGTVPSVAQPADDVASRVRDAAPHLALLAAEFLALTLAAGAAFNRFRM